MMHFEDITHCAAIVCSHVANEDQPILHATRDEPIIPEDSGWQFLCGRNHHEESEGRTWLLEEVVDHDNSLQILMNSDIGHSFDRPDQGSSWMETEYKNTNAA